MRSMTSSGVAARKYSKNSLAAEHQIAIRFEAARRKRAHGGNLIRGNRRRLRACAVANATAANVRSSVRMAIGRSP